MLGLGNWQWGLGEDGIGGNAEEGCQEDIHSISTYLHLTCQAISFFFRWISVSTSRICEYMCIYIYMIICTYVYVHKYRTHSTGDFYHLFLYTCINSSGAWHFCVQKNRRLQRIVWRVNRDPKIEVTKSIWKNASEIPRPTIVWMVLKPWYWFFETTNNSQPVSWFTRISGCHQTVSSNLPPKNP